MRTAFRFRRSQSWLLVMLGCILAVAAAVLVFDWNWLRGPVERYLSEKSGRAVRIGELRVEIGLAPTVHLGNVYVENPAWADRRPMAVAREVSFTVTLASLWRDRPIVSRIVLVDADVDLERHANGLRNWRLTNPDYRGPGRIRVLLLEAHRSRVRFVNRQADLDLVGTSVPLPREEEGPQGETLTSTITLEGTFRGVKFSGSSAAGRFITFRDSNRFFPLRGHVASGGTRLEFDGLFADLIDFGPLDADLRLSGPTLAALHPFVLVRPAPSRPYRLEAHVKQAARVYEVSRFKGRVGDTDIAGEGRYDRSRDRPFVSAALRSERADFADLAAFTGLRSAGDGGPGAPAGQAARENDSGKRTGSKSFFPAGPLPVDALKAFDVEGTLHARELRSAGTVLLGRIHIAARLADGVLQTKALDLDMAGGHVSGALTFDSASVPPAARVHLDLAAVRLEQVLAALSLPGRAAGPIGGRIELTGYGDSIAALARTASGSVQASVNDGRISNLVDAKLRMNPLAVFGAWLKGESAVTVHCAAAAFDVQRGVGRSRAIALDTDRTRVDGGGSINLREERLDLLLVPEPKRRGLFDRRESIRVRGPFRDLKVSLEKREPDDARPDAGLSRCG